MPARVTLALIAALCALFSFAPAASAVTQTKDDAPGDSPFNYNSDRTDLRQITWDVTAEQVKIDITVAPETSSSNQFYVFLDTNKDGKSDFAVHGYTGHAGQSYPNAAKFRLSTTTDSRPDCQRVVMQGNQAYAGQELARDDAVPAGDNAGQVRYSWSFPAGMIGGAQTFDWAAYGMGFDIFDNRFDYMPDATNYDVNRPNPVTTVKDYCDTDNSGVKGDGGDTEDSQAGQVPLVMSEGFTFPDENGGGGAWGDVRADTTYTGQMPNVAKLRIDQARTRITKAVGPVDFQVKELNVAKPPKGVGFGDVMTQTPAAGTPLTSGFNTLPVVTLDVYAGPRPKGKQDCLDKLVKEVKGMELVAAGDLLKKAGCRVLYDFKLGSGDKEAVTKVTPRQSDLVELQAVLPSKPVKQNLFLNVRENPNQLSFDAPRPDEKYPGFNLLSSSDQSNCMTIQVVDRYGRLVQNAQVRLDTTDVAAPKDPNVRPTDDKGETSVCALLPKAGRLDIVTWVVGTNDLAIYGGHSFTVVNGDKMKTGALWYTSSGRVLKKHKIGKWVVEPQRSRATVRGAAAGKDYGPLVNWLVWLFTGNNPTAVQTLSEPTIGSGTKLHTLCGGRNGSCPAVLAVGDGPVGKGGSDLVKVTAGTVVSAGGANAVAAGGANVVAAGGGNVIAAGGGNMVNGATAGVIAAGGGNVIAAGGGNLVDARTVKILGDGASGLISDNGLGLISDNGLGLISDNGLGLISDNGLGLKAAVGNGLISIGNG
jgi:hypothetical protein